MNPITDETVQKRLTKLVPLIDVTYPTMKSYIETGKFSAHVCLQIETETNGDITAYSLRPDLFKPTPAHRRLAEACVNNFVEYMESDKYEMIIAVLNFLESRQTDLYKELLRDIAQLNNGKLFVAQRLAHRNNEQI